MIYIVCSKENHLTSWKDQKEMSRDLLRTGLLTEHNIDVRESEIITNTWGKPFLKDHREVHFNVSHCSGGVALSISSCRTGIDIEKVRSFSMTTARKVLSEEELRTVMNSGYPEREFFIFWTLKESYTKALGTGLSYPMYKINFIVDRDLKIQSNRKGCVFCLFENELNFVTAVCYLSKEIGYKETAVIRFLS